MLGDHVEVGCNSVLNPGTVIGRNSNIYPLSRVRGVIPANHIFKDKDNVVLKIVMLFEKYCILLFLSMIL